MKGKLLDIFYAEQQANFGNRLRKLRKSKKMTQVDLEIATGIANTELSKIENGLVNFEFYTVCKLAHALAVPIADLFGE
jgi:transcriptional regulator with XRE-family HTH domain